DSRHGLVRAAARWRRYRRELPIDRRGGRRKPRCRFLRPAERRRRARGKTLGFRRRRLELLGVAPLEPRKLVERPLVLHLRPPARRRKIRIAVRGGDDVREDLAGGVQRGFDVRAGAGAETLRELTIPGVARRLGRVGEPSPQLIEVPVALELVLIEAAIRLVENFDRPGVV